MIHAQIDVVSEEGFPGLVDTIQSELRQIASATRAQEERLLRSAIDQKRVVAQKQAVASLPRSRNNAVSLY